jgi:hypothetical protein
MAVGVVALFLISNASAGTVSTFLSAYTYAQYGTVTTSGSGVVNQGQVPTSSCCTPPIEESNIFIRASANGSNGYAFVQDLLSTQTVTVTGLPIGYATFGAEVEVNVSAFAELYGAISCGSAVNGNLPVANVTVQLELVVTAEMTQFGKTTPWVSPAMSLLPMQTGGTGSWGKMSPAMPMNPGSTEILCFSGGTAYEKSQIQSGTGGFMNWTSNAYYVGTTINSVYFVADLYATVAVNETNAASTLTTAWGAVHIVGNDYAGLVALRYP